MKVGFAFQMACAGILTIAAADAACAATATRADFGRLPDGTRIEAVTLTGANGVRARVMTLGATLQAFEAPDRNGRLADITLGHDTAAAYVTQPNFWGQTVGRYANRIAGGRFTLDGKTYQLPLNDKTNSLHGGTTGFDKAVWRIVSVTPSGPRASVTMALTSPAGDQGYPGKLDVEVTYALDDTGALTIDFTAKTDAPTIVNLTNHALFDLLGLTGVHVNRTVRALEDEGLIARTGHRVRLLDIDRLRQLSPLPPRQPAFEPAWLPAAK